MLDTLDRARTRLLSWPACLNARDVGGYPATGGTTRFGALVRADTLCRLSDEGRTAMAAYGVSAIVDLRSASELEAQPHPFGPGAAPTGSGPSPVYHNVALVDPALDARLKGTPSLVAAYATILDGARERIAEAIRSIADAPPGAVVVHCQGGKDRTGIVVALALSVAGVPRDDIALDYALSEIYLERLFEPAANGAGLDGGGLEHLIADRAGLMRATLDELDGRYGDVEHYLEVAGVDRPTIERLRARLVSGDPQAYGSMSSRSGPVTQTSADCASASDSRPDRRST